MNKLIDLIIAVAAGVAIVVALYYLALAAGIELG